MRSPSIAHLALAMAALSAPAIAGVIKVPADYLNLQVAVNNAVDGDVILIQPAAFAGPVDIGDKSLTLVAEFGQAVTPKITIHDLSANKLVVLRGLSGDGIGFVAGPNDEGLVLTGNLGHVVVEGGYYRGALGHNAVRITDSAHVSFAHCAFIAGGGADAIDSTGSNVAVTASNLTGGDANPPSSETGNPGGDAIHLGSGVLYVSGCRLVGGDGSSGHCDFDPIFGSLSCGDGGDGGNGLVVYDGSALWEHGNVFEPGAGKPGGDDGVTTSPGSGGAPVVPLGSAVATKLVVPARDTEVTGMLKEGQGGSLLCEGRPGDLALVWLSLGPAWGMLPGYAGVLQIDNRSAFNLLLPIAPTGPAGAVSVPFTAPQLPAGLQSLTIHLQGIFIDANGLYRLAPRTILVLVDSAF